MNTSLKQVETQALSVTATTQIIFQQPVHATLTAKTLVTIQPYLTRRLIVLSFRAVARNLERLLMRPKPKIPRVARNDKVR